MFCPNCATRAAAEQKYCRFCGLPLEQVSRAIAGNQPVKAFFDLQRKKEFYRKLGVISLCIFLIIGFCFFFALVVYYKMIFLGATTLIVSGLSAFVVFGLLAAIFLVYSYLLQKDAGKFVRRENELTAHQEPLMQLEEKPFDPAVVPESVTDNTTELLYAERRKTTNELG